MPKEVMDDLDEIGRDLTDLDEFVVNKRRAPISRIRTWLIATVNWVTNGMLRQSAGVSVIGRSANSTGNVADITASSNDTFLQRVGNALVWAGLTIGMVADGLLTRAKLANASGQSVIGRATSGSGAVADISAGTDNRLLGQSGGVLSFLRATLAMLADGTALSVIGRSANSSGVYGDIAAANDGEVLRRSGTALGFGRLAMAGLGVWPAAAMYRNTGQTITSGAGAATVTLDTSEFATGGADAPVVQTGSNRIDITRAGLYRVHARAGIATNSDGTGKLVELSILIGGVQTSTTKMLCVSTGTVIECSALLSLAASDQVTMTLFQNCGNNVATNTNAFNRPRLSVEYVGPAT